MSNKQANTAYQGQQALFQLPFVENEMGEPSEESPTPSATAAEEPLTVHPYSGLIGRRSTEQRQQLSATMQASRGIVEVFLYEDQILWDPDRYSIAMRLGLDIQPIEYREDDPIAFICSRVLHEIHHDKGTRALIVTGLYPWTERGRPGNSSKNEDFPVEGLQRKTTGELAFLAGVSESYIEKAKRICGFGLIDLIIDEGMKFGSVYRKLNDVCRAGLGDELRTGAKDLDALWLRACELQPAARDSGRHRTPTKRDLANRIQELESEIQILRGQLDKSASGDVEFTPGALESGDQPRELEEQRDRAIRRADAAEAKLVAVAAERDALSAEIEELKRNFHDADLRAFGAGELNIAET